MGRQAQLMDKIFNLLILQRDFEIPDMEQSKQIERIDPDMEWMKLQFQC